jgi:microsomal dipeptidase-like Zn-dependent dipeptidase
VLNLICAGSFLLQPLPASAQEVWGFADLHVHLATHLAWGADSSGRNGVLWGIPQDLSGNDSLQNDLPASDPSTHDASLGFDPRTKGIHSKVLQKLDEQTNSGSIDTQGDGWPTYKTWPNSRLYTYQQMPPTSIFRAFQGGLRLMLADATDTQLLAALWRYNGQNPLVQDWQFDVNSAIAQLNYIEAFAKANSSWMQVVDNPKDARAVIAANKLAVILGVEMDSLSLTDIQDLFQNHRVRHVIPVHLADNFFGGTAAYSSTFNSNSNFLNGSWEGVVWDNCLNFNFSTNDLTTLTYGSCPWLFWQTCPNTTNMDQVTYQNLGYAHPASCNPTPGATLPACGVRNKRGIDRFHMIGLMQLPILLDIVHMSQQAADETLALAEQFGYPVMDSHTGIRDDDTNRCLVKTMPTIKRQIDERSLPYSQAKRIKALRGVIGFGTVRNPTNDPTQDPFGEWMVDYLRLRQPDIGFDDGRQIALGTDMNGLTWEIPQDTAGRTFAYPFVNVATQYGGPLALPAKMDKFALNSRQYSITTDGIATYGMLPDFLAFEDQIGKKVLGPLFHSAEDTIAMWELAVAAAPNVNPCGGGKKCCGGMRGNTGFCAGPCVAATANCPPPPVLCLNGEQCCGGDDGTGHCVGACISSSGVCTAENVCPSNEKCCSGVEGNACAAGCVPSSSVCQSSACPSGKKCCGGPNSVGACSGPCIAPTAQCQ